MTTDPRTTHRQPGRGTAVRRARDQDIERLVKMFASRLTRTELSDYERVLRHRNHLRRESQGRRHR